MIKFMDCTWTGMMLHFKPWVASLKLFSSPDDAIQFSMVATVAAAEANFCCCCCCANDFSFLSTQQTILVFISFWRWSILSYYSWQFWAFKQKHLNKLVVGYQLFRSEMKTNSISIIFFFLLFCFVEQSRINWISISLLFDMQRNKRA